MYISVVLLVIVYDPVLAGLVPVYFLFSNRKVVCIVG